MIDTPLTPATDLIRVLILDDDKVDRHRLARHCATLPRLCKITECSTLADFKQRIGRQTFDLLLLDYFLPDGTGLDALKEVRLSQANVNAAVIMITGQGQEEVGQAAIAGGCADYLTKDELSAAAFHRAAYNALEKSALTSQMVAQTYRRAEVERVLAHFATQCARDIKPMLSRMMRQLRDLRATQTITAELAEQRHAAIEDSCTTMWEFLVTLERHQGTDLIQSLEADLPASAAMARRKPPSPFARI